MTYFRDLAIGQTFDFIDDDNRMLNSFFARCTKIGPRTYTWHANIGRRVMRTQVGSIYAQVFHIEDAVPSLRAE